MSYYPDEYYDLPLDQKAIADRLAREYRDNADGIASLKAQLDVAHSRKDWIRCNEIDEELDEMLSDAYHAVFLDDEMRHQIFHPYESPEDTYMTRGNSRA